MQVLQTAFLLMFMMVWVLVDGKKQSNCIHVHVFSRYWLKWHKMHSKVTGNLTVLSQITLHVYRFLTCKTISIFRRNPSVIEEGMGH